MTTSTIVPREMSYANAFHALYNAGRPAKYFDEHPALLPEIEAQVSTAEKVTHLFRVTLEGQNERSLLIEFGGGHIVKTDFINFPALNVTGYEAEYGAGSAALALHRYNVLPTQSRLDEGDQLNFEDLFPSR
jgi:hypothetical protein